VTTPPPTVEVNFTVARGRFFPGVYVRVPQKKKTKNVISGGRGAGNTFGGASVAPSFFSQLGHEVRF